MYEIEFTSKHVSGKFTRIIFADNEEEARIAAFDIICGLKSIISIKTL